MCYNMTSLVGKNNEAVSKKVLDVVVHLMENAGNDVGKDGSLAAILRQFGVEV